MNYQRIKQTKRKVNKLNLRLQALEKLTKQTLEEFKNIEKSCDHELIFINKKYENLAYEYIQYGKCLVCGKAIELTPENLNIDNQEVINSEQIIDIAEKVEKWTLECECSQTKLEMEEAKRIFDDLISNREFLYSKEEIKQEIFKGVNNIKGNTKKK